MGVFSPHFPPVGTPRTLVHVGEAGARRNNESRREEGEKQGATFVSFLYAFPVVAEMGIHTE